MANILVICTANICRSPVAEALLRDRLDKQGLDSWQVSSAGTWANYGQPASSYSVEVLAEQGLDIKNHNSRPVDDQLMEKADLVLCMEEGHMEGLRVEFRRHAAKIYTLSQMSGPSYSVHDPYGEPRPLYERMVAELTKLVDDGMPRILELAQANERQRKLEDEDNS